MHPMNRPYFHSLCSRFYLAVLAVCIAWLVTPVSVWSQQTINVDIQTDAADAYSGKNSPGQTNPKWNHVSSEQVSSLVNAAGSPTAVGLTLQHANGRWKTDWTSHDLLEDFLFRDGGAEAQAIIRGLTSSKRYNLHVYTGVEGGQFRVGGQILHGVYDLQGVNRDPAYVPGASFVRGKNVVVFNQIAPDAQGQIVLYYKDSPLTTAPHGNMAGFTLEEVLDLSVPIHIDIQSSGSSAAYTGSSAYSGGTSQWNHISADSARNLKDSFGNITPVSIDMWGANGRESTSWTTHPLLGDYLYRDAGGTANAAFTGLPPNSAFDVVVYAGPEGIQVSAGGQTARAAYNGRGVGGDPAYAPGAAWVQGQNFTVLRGVYSDANGRLHLRYTDNTQAAGGYGLFSGLSIGKAGTFTGPASNPITPPATNNVQSVVNVAQLGSATPAAGGQLVVSGLPGGASLVLRAADPGPPLKAASGELNWLGFTFPLSTAEWIPATGKMRMTATFGLPFPLFTDDFNNPIQQSVTLEMDATGKISVVGGNIFIKELKAGKTLRLANLALQFNADTQEVGGSVEVSIGNGKPDICSPGENTYPFVGGFIKFRNGQLDTLTVGGSNLRKPVGPAFLDLIQATVRNLTNPNGIWEIEGRMVLNAGCPITINHAADIFPVTLDANGKFSNNRTFSLSGQGKIYNIPVADAGLTVNQNSAQVTTKLNFAGALVADTQLNINGTGISGSATGNLKVPNYVGWGLGGLTFANTTAALDHNGIRGTVSVVVSRGSAGYWTGGYNKRVGYTGRACAPWPWQHRCWNVNLCCVDLWVPRVWIPAIPEVRSSFGYSYSWTTRNLAFSKKSAEVRDPWDQGFRPRIPSPDGNGQITLMTNWDRLDRSSTGFGGRSFEIGSSGNPESVTVVPEGTPGAIFRLTYTAEEVESPSFQLTLPSGTILTTDMGALPFGYENAAGYSRANSEAREVVIVLQNPNPGEYRVVIDNPELLGDFSMDVLGETTPPFGEIVLMEGPTEDGIVDLFWFAADIETPTEISFFLQPDETTGGGILLSSDIIEESTSEDDIGYEIFDLEFIDAPPGSYYIMMKVDDGNNEPYYSYSDYQIEFENPDAPEPVLYVASAPGDGSISLEWLPSESDDIDHYSIVYSENLDSDDLDQSIPVGRDTTTYTLEGLSNGTPYLVSVIASNVEGLSSLPYDIHRVVPTRGPGLTPPVIISTPDTDATAEQQYAYFLLGFDGDEDLHLSDLPAEFEGGELDDSNLAPALRWSLLMGPEGMTLDPSGLLLWVPGENQIGEHQVMVSLSKLNPYPTSDPDAERWITAYQEFTITVLDSFNLNGLESNPYTFISVPPLYTSEFETYRYKPQLLAPDEENDFLVVFGPDGMQVDENNEVVWEVPEDAFGSHVVIRGATSDGEIVEQVYFLHVHLPWNRLPQDLHLVNIARQNEDVFLNWSGSAEKVLIQSSSSLTNPQWETIAGPIDRSVINFHSVKASEEDSVFYRIVEWNDSENPREN